VNVGLSIMVNVGSIPMMDTISVVKVHTINKPNAWQGADEDSTPLD
jgi:hypothetical protein